jgi:uncharacterized protein YndB with AHSA1/START domain
MDPAQPAGSIVVERVMPHPADKIWRALTEGAVIAEWLMQNDFQPRVGHRFNLRAKPIPNMWNGVADCEVLEIDPLRRLAYSWSASGEEAADGLKTVIAWTLTPEAGGTRVRMEQAGFRAKDELGFRSMGGGWPRIVERLEEVAGSLG